MLGFKLASYQSDRGPRSGIVIRNSVHDTADVTGRGSYASTVGVLEDWPKTQLVLRDAIETLSAAAGRPIKDVQLLAPVLRPSGIYCAGANYSDHVDNMAKLLNMPPEPDPHSIGLKPWHFIKTSACLTGPDSTVQAAWSAAALRSIRPPLDCMIAGVGSAASRERCASARR